MPKNQAYIGPQDVDKEISIAEWVNIGKKLAKQKKNSNKTARRAVRGANSKEPSANEILSALRNSFIEGEKGKVYYSFHQEAEAKMPKNTYGKIMREYQGSVPKERNRLVEEHIQSKMPKIENILNKVREGMMFGFAPKKEKKEENLLRFNNLSSINFSAQPSASAAAAYVDPFAGLNANTNVTHKNFTNAGIEIEEETVGHLSKNQRKELLNQLKAMNKSSQNAAINDYLATHALGKGGKRKTRKARKQRKTCKH